MENLQEYVDKQLHIPLGVREAWTYQTYEFLKFVKKLISTGKQYYQMQVKKKTVKVRSR